MDSPPEDNRKDLKLHVLTAKAKHVENLINTKMDEIEELTKVYSETLKKINDIKYTPDHIELMKKLMDRLKDDNGIPSSYAQCNTADQMLNKMLLDVKTQSAFEKAASAKGINAPALSNNEEVLERMRVARKRVEDEELEKTNNLSDASVSR